MFVIIMGEDIPARWRLVQGAMPKLASVVIAPRPHRATIALGAHHSSGVVSARTDVYDVCTF